MSITIRKMRLADVVAVYAIQTEVYVAAMIEAPSLIRDRWLSAPDTAWVAADAQGVCAYLVAYPSLRGSITRLGNTFTLAQNSTCLYLHDLAIAQRASGQQLGTSLVTQALKYASDQEYLYSALVSVQDSHGFWQKLGYLEQHALSQDQLSCLHTYVGNATYFVKTL